MERELTEDDLPALITLAQACAAADGTIVEATTEDFLRGRFFGEGRSTKSMWEEGLVAAVGVRPGPGTWQAVYGLVSPDHRNQGRGGALLDWALDRDGPVRVDTEGLTDGAEALFASRGLEQTFAEDVLRRDLALPLPETAELTTEPWDPDRAYAVYTASFRDRPGFPGWSRDTWVEWISDEFKPEWAFLATVDGADAGFLSGADNGWIVQVGVVPEYRGTGLGKAMVVEAMRRMVADGEPAAVLDVNVNNPTAAGLYRKLGFDPIARRARYALLGRARRD